MVICDRITVSEAVRALSNSVYRTYTIIPRNEAIQIDVCPPDIAPNLSLEDTDLGKFFQRGTTERKAARLLYDLFVNLGEPVIEAGSNYLISKGEDENYAILIYNMEENLPNARAREYIIRLHGLNGKYMVKNLRLGCKNIQIQSEAEHIRQKNREYGYRRHDLYKIMDSYPLLSEQVMTAIDSLTFEVPMDEFCGELILIDKCL